MNVDLVDLTPVEAGTLFSKRSASTLPASSSPESQEGSPPCQRAPRRRPLTRKPIQVEPGQQVSNALLRPEWPGHRWCRCTLFIVAWGPRILTVRGTMSYPKYRRNPRNSVSALDDRSSIRRSAPLLARPVRDQCNPVDGTVAGTFACGYQPPSRQHGRDHQRHCCPLRLRSSSRWHPLYFVTLPIAPDTYHHEPKRPRAAFLTPPPTTPAMPVVRQHGLSLLASTFLPPSFGGLDDRYRVTWVLMRTPFGNRVFGVGGNEQAAQGNVGASQQSQDFALHRQQCPHGS